MSELTPMLKQYRKMKAEYRDALLLFRMGDFYEMFYEDAQRGARVLGLTLTSRNHGKAEHVPLAGLPHHALENYLPRLVKAGYKVAICEQVEDPKKAKGLVKREVVEVVTAGTALSEALLDSRRNNFLMSVMVDGKQAGLCVTDLSTGEFQVTEVPAEGVWNELERIRPAEILIAEEQVDSFMGEFERRLGAQSTLTKVEGWTFGYDGAYDRLREHFGVASLKGFGCEHLHEGIRAAGAALSYLQANQRRRLPHISRISRYDTSEYMVLDPSTQRNLELTASMQSGGKEGTLLSILDRTRTPMGARLLRRWLSQPLKVVGTIEERLDAVEEMVEERLLLEALCEKLKNIGDLERLIAKVACGRANGRDLVALRRSLEQLPGLRKDLHGARSPLLIRCREDLGDLDDVTTLIKQAIVDEPPVTLTEGGIIREGFNKELDELREVGRHGRDWIARLQSEEQHRTGISSLKVGYNRVFGYYIEVTKPNLDRVPSEYIRKQTLVNAERFITPALKEYEAKVLGAEERIGELEYKLFVDVRDQVARRAVAIQDTAAAIGILDVIAAFAEVAQAEDYVRPVLDEGDAIEIKDGRHPVVEQMLPEGQFVPNDVQVNTSRDQILIITGPNMSGKCLRGHTLVISDRGVLPIGDFKPSEIFEDTFKELNIEIRGINGRKNTSHFYYGGRQKTKKITTRLGYEIEGTYEHRILVRTKSEKNEWKRLEDITKEDFVILDRNTNLWGSETEIQFDSARYRGVKRYALPEVLDTSLAYLMGLLVGDGTLTYTHSYLLSTADAFIKDAFCEIHSRLFGYTVKCKSNGQDLFVSSWLLREFLAALGLDYSNAYEKHIPKSILQAPKDMVISFLQGLFDTDGYADTKYGNVSVLTSSLRLAKEVQILLLNLGMVSSLRMKRTKVNTNYQVHLFGENAIKFYDEVGFRLPRKQERRNLISDLRRPNVGSLPHLRHSLKELQKRIVTKKNKRLALKKVKNINSIFYTYLPQGKNISYAKLRELIAFCKMNEVDCEEFEELNDRHYFYDKVAEIEESEGEVYDLTVPGSHSFVANGMVNHNSTYLRQIGLIVLLAQIGSFVPARKAHIGVVDRIFTRVGASDNLAAGESTFLVEMNEAANILHNATPKSLILLDEIGRGTSTFDGLSIAWAITEFLHNVSRVRARTLFATHYHELVELERVLPRVRNYNVAVREDGHSVVFLRKIVRGGCDHSYGIHVAKLAGLPQEVIERAEEILKNLEEHDLDPMRLKRRRKRRAPGGSEVQMSLFESARHPVLDEIRHINPQDMTPLEALNRVVQWKKELEKAERDGA